MSHKTKEGRQGKARQAKGRGEGKGGEGRPLRTLVWDVSMCDVYYQLGIIFQAI